MTPPTPAGAAGTAWRTSRTGCRCAACRHARSTRVASTSSCATTCRAATAWAALPSPRRGYAVVRLALDLGLRGIEISRLQLTDIDWRQGTLTLKHTKSRRQDLLPLPTSTGRSLEAYVRHERPKTSDPAVFVHRLAPHDQPVGVDAIRRIVRDAFRRAGIPHGRGHALRHTLA